MASPSGILESSAVSAPVETGSAKLQGLRNDAPALPVQESGSDVSTSTSQARSTKKSADTFFSQKLHTRLFRYASRYTTEPEDVVQDVMLRLLRADLSGVRCIEGYAMQCCKMMLRDRVRKAAARPQGCEVDPRSLQVRESSVAHLAEQGELVEQALSALKPRAQIIVRLFYFEGLTKREIAAAIGDTAAAVKSAKFQAVLKMRARLVGRE